MIPRSLHRIFFSSILSSVCKCIICFVHSSLLKCRIIEFSCALCVYWASFWKLKTKKKTTTTFNVCRKFNLVCHSRCSTGKCIYWKALILFYSFDILGFNQLDHCIYILHQYVWWWWRQRTLMCTVCCSCHSHPYTRSINNWKFNQNQWRAKALREFYPIWYILFYFLHLICQAN